MGLWCNRLHASFSSPRLGPRPQHLWGPLAGLIDLRQISASDGHARCRASSGLNGLCLRVGGLDDRLCDSVYRTHQHFRVVVGVHTQRPQGHAHVASSQSRAPAARGVVCRLGAPIPGLGHRVTHGTIGRPSWHHHNLVPNPHTDRYRDSCVFMR